MSKAISSLLLVGIKKEETNTIEDCVLAPVIKRQCCRLTTQHGSVSSESDCASSGDEWHPPPRSTSSAFSNESNTPLLPPSPAYSVPTDELSAANSLFSCTAVLTTGGVITSNTLEIKRPKCEPDDPSCRKPTDESEGDSCLTLHPYACDICGRKFARSQHLRRHIDCLHKALRPFACEICGKDFSSLSDKKRHINKVHKQIREFVCESCGKGFAQKTDMKRHINTVHQGLRPYACDVCGSSFGQRSYLRIHINRLHKNLREFACEFCGKAFVTNGEAQRHIKAVHKKPT